MTHTAQWWSRRCIGLAEVELENGKTLTVGIYKVGGSFCVDRESLHPSDSGSVEAAIRSIGVRYGSRVKEWKWSAYRG